VVGEEERTAAAAAAAAAAAGAVLPPGYLGPSIQYSGVVIKQYFFRQPTQAL
jgi:hypothetical protein